MYSHVQTSTWLIDWILFYAESAIFQPCNGGTYTWMYTVMYSIIQTYTWINTIMYSIFQYTIMYILYKHLFLSRLVHSGRLSNPASGSDIMTFGTRCGTRNGVETHIFRVETQRDLAYWSRALVQGSHGVAAIIKEVACRKSAYLLKVFIYSQFSSVHKS